MHQASPNAGSTFKNHGKLCWNDPMYHSNRFLQKKSEFLSASVTSLLIQNCQQKRFCSFFGIFDSTCHVSLKKLCYKGNLNACSWPNKRYIVVWIEPITTKSRQKDLKRCILYCFFVVSGPQSFILVSTMSKMHLNFLSLAHINIISTLVGTMLFSANKCHTDTRQITFDLIMNI